MTHYRRRAHTLPTPLFLVTLATNQKAPGTFKLKTPCNIIIRIEAYRSQNGFMQCYNFQRFGYIWMHFGQPPLYLCCGVFFAIVNIQGNMNQRVSQSAAIATCKTRNRRTQQVTEAAVMQNRR
jgi:hypothetical protein